MIKSIWTDGTASVTFTLDPRVQAQSASVCGEWNGWACDANVMGRNSAGGFNLTVDLEPGRSYRFRYLLDGDRWENDWDADAYVPNAFGGDDSVVDLTSLGSVIAAAKPSATQLTPRRITATKKAEPARSRKPAAETRTKKTLQGKAAPRKSPK